MKKSLAQTPLIIKQLIVKTDRPETLSAHSDLYSVHACEDSYLIAGSASEVDAYVRSEHCLASKECSFPIDPWRIEYKYLGDHRLGQEVCFDLRLRADLNHNFQYELGAPVPAGLSFKNGFLQGRAYEATEILNLPIRAWNEKSEHSKTYQIRFYKDKNSARSFLHNHYLQIGCGDELVDYDINEIYYRKFYGAPTEVGTPVEEAVAAAKKIQKAAGDKSIFLFVSGGIDSQVTLQSFALAGVPFQAVLLVDTNNCNSDDVFYCREYCRRKNIRLLEYSFDIVSYIKNYRYIDPALTYRFNNPEYGVLLNLIEAFPGFGVFAGRPISVSRAPGGERVLGLAVDETWSRARYLERNNLQGCPEFLIYTQELVYSFLKTDFAQKFGAGESWGYESKIKLLKSAGFDVQNAPPIKYTGFEKLYSFFPSDEFGNDLWLQHRAPLKIRFPNPSTRNAMLITNEGVRTEPLITKPYEDGFSYRYLKKNNLADFH